MTETLRVLWLTALAVILGLVLGLVLVAAILLGLAIE